MLALNCGIETMLPPGGTTVRIPPARAVIVRVALAGGCLLFPCHTVFGTATSSAEMPQAERRGLKAPGHTAA